MIEVNNLTTNRVNEDFFKKVAKKVLMGENKERLELSIVLVGQNRIKALNKKYRKKNQVTDVLTFNYNNSGEVVICLREVKKNAKRFNLPAQILQDKTWEGKAFEKELTKVLIHGILHLIGYSHEGSEEKVKEMQEREECYLSQ